MGDVADYRNLQTLELTLLLTDGHHIEKSLRGMLVPTISSVNNSRVDVLGEQGGDTRSPVAYDDNVGGHRLDIFDRIKERFALFETRCGGAEIYRVGGETFLGDFKAHPCASRVLHEEITDHDSTQGRYLLHAPLSHLLEVICDI